MSKKKSSKKSIKKLHLDKPTSHGGWPDGHSGSYRDPKTPVNKQITKFLSDMGLLDDDNPRARLSEDKIRVKKIVLEGLLRKILMENNENESEFSEIDLKDLSPFNIISLFSRTRATFRKGKFWEGKTQDVYLNDQNINAVDLNKIRKDYPLGDFLIGDYNKLIDKINKSTKKEETINLESDNLVFINTKATNIDSNFVSKENNPVNVRHLLTNNKSDTIGGFLRQIYGDAQNYKNEFINVTLCILRVYIELNSEKALKDIGFKDLENKYKYSTVYNLVDDHFKTKTYSEEELKFFKSKKILHKYFTIIIRLIYYDFFNNLCFDSKYVSILKENEFAVIKSCLSYRNPKYYQDIIISDFNLKVSHEENSDFEVANLYEKIKAYPTVTSDSGIKDRKRSYKVLRNEMISVTDRPWSRKTHEEKIEIGKQFLEPRLKKSFEYILNDDIVFLKNAPYEIKNKLNQINIDLRNISIVSQFVPFFYELRINTNTLEFDVSEEMSYDLLDTLTYELLIPEELKQIAIPLLMDAKLPKSSSYSKTITNISHLNNKNVNIISILEDFSTQELSKTYNLEEEYSTHVIAIKILEEKLTFLYNQSEIVLSNQNNTESSTLSIIKEPNIPENIVNLLIGNYIKGKKTDLKNGIEISLNFLRGAGLNISVDTEALNTVKNVFSDLRSLLIDITEDIKLGIDSINIDNSAKFKNTPERLKPLVKHLLFQEIVFSLQINKILAEIYSIDNTPIETQTFFESIENQNKSFDIKKVYYATTALFLILSQNSSVEYNEMRNKYNIVLQDFNFNKEYENKTDPYQEEKSQLTLLPDPEEDETTQIPDTNIEIAADPEEHEEDEDEKMVAESKLYRMVLKDLFEHLNR